MPIEKKKVSNQSNLFKKKIFMNQYDLTYRKSNGMAFYIKFNSKNQYPISFTKQCTICHE